MNRNNKNAQKHLQITSITDFTYLLDMFHGGGIWWNSESIPDDVRDDIIKECQQLLEILQNQEYNYLAKEFFEYTLWLEVNTIEALDFFKSLFVSIFQWRIQWKQLYTEEYIDRWMQFSDNLWDFLEQYLPEAEKQYRDYCMKWLSVLREVNELKNSGEDISLFEQGVYLLADMLDSLRMGDFLCLFATKMNLPQSEKRERKQMISCQVKFRKRISQIEHILSVLQDKIENFDKYKQQEILRERVRTEKRMQKEQLRQKRLMSEQNKMHHSCVSNETISPELKALNKILRRLGKSECRLKNLETKWIWILTESHWNELWFMRQHIQEIPEVAISDEIRKKQQDILHRIAILFQQRENL